MTSDSPDNSATIITFHDLVTTVRSKKNLLLAIILACVLLAGSVYLFKTPSYKTETQLLPPTPADLMAYNSIVSSINTIGFGTRERNSNKTSLVEISPDSAYQIFIRHLTSYMTRQRFFYEYYLPAQKRETNSAEEELWSDLKKELRITIPKQQNEFISTVEITGKDRELISSWANEYINLATKASREQLAQTLIGNIQIQRDLIDQQIEALRITAEDARLKRVQRLEDALQIAKGSGLEEAPQRGNLITSYSGDNLYMRGVKALTSELEITLTRSNNDPYIPGLEGLIMDKNLLSMISINSANIKPVTIDRQAQAPEESADLSWFTLLGLGLAGGLLTCLAIVGIITLNRKINSIAA